MNLLRHNAEGATIHLDPRELLMVMALIQEGRCSFECDGETGERLDRLFCKAVVQVQEARRNREAMLALQPGLTA
jgi:hypothetical protein